MMYGTGAMETMQMPASSTMSSAAATGMSTSDASMSSMDSSHSSSSMMSMFFTSDYQGVPVLFKSLSAATGAKAFGIFVILFATAFAFRGLSFLSTYIEQKVFASQLQASDDADNSIHIHSSSLGKLSDIESSEVSSKSERPTQTKSAVAKFFDYSAVGIYRDFIRLLLSVLTVIIGYDLMLAVMSFVVLYFFAVVLGIAFGEIFFMRLSYALDMNTPDSVCLSVLH